MAGEVIDALPLDWHRCRRYIADDIAWMRWCIEHGQIDLALLCIAVTRSYIAVDLHRLEWERDH